MWMLVLTLARYRVALFRDTLEERMNGLRKVCASCCDGFMIR